MKIHSKYITTAAILILFLFFSFFAGSAILAENTPKQIISTWQNDPSSTISLTWRTENSGDSYIYYTMSSEAEEFDKIAAEKWTFTETENWVHGGEITDLEPDTLYTLKVETEGETSDKFQLQTAPAESREISFIMGADSRTNRDERREINERAAGLEPEFVMFAGDFTEGPHDESAWENMLEDWDELMVTDSGRKIPLLPAPGTYEVSGGYGGEREDAQFYFNSFLLPHEENYYMLDYGPDLRLISLDSDHISSVYRGDQLVWLEEVLLEGDSQNRWQIAQYHVPAWPGARGFFHDTSRRIRDHWVPLFEEYGVKLANEAQDHVLKITEEISGMKDYQEDFYSWIYQGKERAQEDFDPDEDYTPWSFPELSKLSGGDWEEVEGIDTLQEGMAEFPYYSSLYLIQEEGEIQFEQVYSEVANSTLYEDFWEKVPNQYLGTDEGGVVHIGDGGWGAPLRSPHSADETWYMREAVGEYHFFEVVVKPEPEKIKVYPHVWWETEKWEKLPGIELKLE